MGAVFFYYILIRILQLRHNGILSNGPRHGELADDLILSTPDNESRMNVSLFFLEKY